MATANIGATLGATGISASTPERTPPVRPTPDQTQVAAQGAAPQTTKTEPQSQAPTPAVSYDAERLRAAADSLGQVVSAVNEGISIRIDESTDRLITEIVNRETNEVIKQIPPEEMVRLSGRLREFLGILLDIEV